MPLSLDQFEQQLAASGLLSPDEVASTRQASGANDAEQLARELVRQKKLTAYQAQQAYSGKAKSLVLGNYVILDKLGQGGMGMVLKAEHRRMKRLVALKVLSPAIVKSKDTVARFHREVQAAARLEHPNIVIAYDADEANGTHFFVMQFVNGKDLSSVVKSKGPLPVEQAVNCIIQAARGLEFAHKRGVIHRDIKPANLLLDADGTVKILDMGLARIEGETGTQAELTSTGAVMGTIDYMAPEQALSTKSADARSDIYSLGISLWYLLVGRPAFEGDSLLARMLAHREAPIPSLVEALQGREPARLRLLEALDAVFQKMIAKKPQDRFQSMTEVIAALETCLRDGPGNAPNLSVPSSEDSKFHEFLAGLGQTEMNPGGSASRATKSARSRTATQMLTDAEPTMSDSASDAPTDPQTMVSPAGSRRGQKKSQRGSLWWNDRRVQIGGGIAATVIVLAAVTLLFQTPRGTIRVEIKDPDITVTLKGTEIMVAGADPQPISIRPGEYAFLVSRGDFSFETKTLVLKNNETVTLTVDLLPDRLEATARGQVVGSKALPKAGADVATTTAATPTPKAPAAAAPARTQGDWIDLFDGFYSDKWQSLGPFRTDNRLFVASSQGLAITNQEFGDFELEFEWKISDFGNGGVYYRNSRSFLKNAAVPGIEYQLLDNARHPNGQKPETTAGSLYSLVAPSADVTRPTGEFNVGRIVAQGTVVEHWLNGTKVLTYDSASPEFQAKAKTGKIGELFLSGKPLRGPIALQGHTGTVSFRKIRIRELYGGSQTTAGWAPLFNGKDLAGWRGDVRFFTVENGVLVATGERGDLITTREYADFELELQFRLSSQADSGVGLRYSGQDLPMFNGIEVQLVDGQNSASYVPNERCGGLMQLAYPRTLPFQCWPDWNALHVHCEGRKITVKMNGLVTVAADAAELLKQFPNHPGLQRSRGSLCLITTQGRAEFREIRIRELSNSAAIPKDAATFQGHAYKFFPQQLTWKDAQARCAELGGHLVIITSPEENAFVASLVEQAGHVDSWIGMTDEAQEGRWLWVDGSPLQWTHWFPGNPNNKGGLEHYGLFSRELGGTAINWRWVDQPNASTQHKPGYVCEWDASASR